ncbi:molybdopterin-dependent oxidoreductase [Solicola sp. PLA-1-18]|uniref:molybdopterin-dependent oxidoreductase n=1 Tax=Solicola sp. PLA-1-18 TaxID=3380532 RepID=UPI003B7F69C6
MATSTQTSSGTTPPTETPGRGAAVVAGTVAALVGLAVTEVVARVLGASASPVVATGEAVIAAAPGALARPAIDLLGTADKPALVSAVVVVVVLLGAVLGTQVVRRPGWAAAGFIAVAVAGAVAVVSRPDSGQLDAVSPLVGGIITVTVARWLLRPRTEQADGENRRRFLVEVAVVVAGAVVLGGASRVVGAGRRAAEGARSTLRLPVRPAVVPAGADLGVDGVSPFLTPSSEFYRIDTALSTPSIDPAEWSLRIHGMVDREITLTYQDLLDRGLSDAWVTLCCVSNEVGGDLIGNTVWSGVPIAGILAEAGVQRGADALLSTSEDGWTCGTPIEALTDGRDALLAVAMDGEPLPIEHGFPVRQVVPGLYGYVSATKWVVDWEVTRFDDIDAYWTQRGWGEKGPVKTQSRIDTPRSDVDAGTVAVAGVAWAQHTGIEKVEIKVGDGRWQQARLGRVPNVDTWVQWVVEWDAEPGDHVIQVRATDRSGYTQTSERADVLPDGATGWDSVSITVR